MPIPLSSTKERGDGFFEAVVAPVLNRTSSAAKEETMARIQQAQVVLSTVEREAVRKTQAYISHQESAIDGQGDAAQDFFKSLFDIVAEAEGPTPFLARLYAVEAIAKLDTKELINLDNNQLYDDLKLAITTERFPRGSILLWGALKGALEKGKEARQGRWQVNWDPDPQNLQEMDKWKREAMMVEAKRFFSEVPPSQLSMLFQEWQPGNEPPVRFSGQHDRGVKVPKYVIRLCALEDEEGIKETRCHICSPEMQIIAAVRGMPRSGNYDVGGDSVRRNPTLLRTYASLKLDESKGKKALRIQGVAVNPLYVLNDQEREQLEENLAKNKGSLPFAVAKEILPSDASSHILAARALRAVRDFPQDTQIRKIDGVIKSVIDEFKRPAKVEVIRKEEIAENNEVSILESYVRQFDREQGRLDGRSAVSIEEAESSLNLVLHGILCTLSDTGEPIVRAEKDIVKLAEELSRKALSPEDLKRFSRPFKGTIASKQNTTEEMPASICVETIVRKTIKGIPTQPPVRFKKSSKHF